MFPQSATMCRPFAARQWRRCAGTTALAFAAMIDVRRLRTEFDAVHAAMARRGGDAAAQLDRARQLDERQRELVAQRDEVRARVKNLSRDVGKLRRDGRVDEAEKLQAESRDLGGEEAALDTDVDAVGSELRDLLLRIPNVPAVDVPEGAGEADNPVLRVVGFDPDAYGEHQRVPHWEIGEQLGILDLERAVKISGSMFTMFRKQGATLARALCQLALDRNADSFEEIRPPSLVLSSTLTATGQLPKFADDAYAVERDDLWCIPTAEVPLTSLARDEILDEADLPMRLMAYSPCFRREAGSAGRDTRGLLRTHEFDKVELLAYTTPEQGSALMDEILTRAATTIEALGLPYRLVGICAGDLGQSHHRSVDIEVYAPGVDQWLEVSSVSWFSDYQARRANIRYRPLPVEGQKGRPGAQTAHTVNGSALAVPRVWAALVETHRQPDGTIALPGPLVPYFRGATSIG
jgi:seryl-tRNA synthetase